MKGQQIFLLSSTIQNQRFFITSNDVTINNSIEIGVVDMNARRHTHTQAEVVVWHHTMLLWFVTAAKTDSFRQHTLRIRWQRQTLI